MLTESNKLTRETLHSSAPVKTSDHFPPKFVLLIKCLRRENIYKTSAIKQQRINSALTSEDSKSSVNLKESLHAVTQHSRYWEVAPLVNYIERQKASFLVNGDKLHLSLITG